jgi:dienelactone hydrolase
MSVKKLAVLLGLVCFLPFSATFNVHAGEKCLDDWRPATYFVDFQSFDPQQQPPTPLTVQGKLKLPVRYNWKNRCFVPEMNAPAVVILHGSAGIDFRGDFYARALNAAGIATFEIDMWEARGISSAADRPPVPLSTYPDAFEALRFLSDHPNIDPNRIGVMGFSWGGVVTMASATELYASQLGGELRFAAHAAHYPVCYANNSAIPGTEFFNLTGAPILVQIGEKDDYDKGPGQCLALRDSLDPEEQSIVEVVVYEGAFHGWDRLAVPITVEDPFSNLGDGGEVEIVPDVDQAYKARSKLVRFFRRHL